MLHNWSEYNKRSQCLRLVIGMLICLVCIASAGCGAASERAEDNDFETKEFATIQGVAANRAIWQPRHAGHLAVARLYSAWSHTRAEEFIRNVKTTQRLTVYQIDRLGGASVVDSDISEDSYHFEMASTEIVLVLRASGGLVTQLDKIAATHPEAVSNADSVVILYDTPIVSDDFSEACGRLPRLDSMVLVYDDVESVVLWGRKPRLRLESAARSLYSSVSIRKAHFIWPYADLGHAFSDLIAERPDYELPQVVSVEDPLEQKWSTYGQKPAHK